MASPSSLPLELTLTLKLSYVPKTIQNVLRDLKEIKNPTDKLLVLNDYIHQHEEELNFIQSFKHHIPQCGLFLTDAIKTLTEEYMKIRKNMESGRQPMTDFLSKGKECGTTLDTIKTCNNGVHEKPLFPCNYKVPGTFIQLLNSTEPFNFGEESFLGSAAEKSSTSSRLVERGSGSKIPRHESSGQGGHNLRAYNPIMDNHQLKPLSQSISKKKRMSWTEEKHARFLRALDQSGGIDAATPKRILEKMQVEGLTSDQVKSHLQYENEAQTIFDFRNIDFTNAAFQPTKKRTWQILKIHALQRTMITFEHQKGPQCS